MSFFIKYFFGSIFIIITLACSRKEPVTPEDNIVKNIPAEAVKEVGESGETDTLVDTGHTQIELQILDIRLVNLVDTDVGLAANTEIGSLEAVMNMESEVEVSFTIKEEENSDYDKFSLEKSLLYSKEEIIGSRRFVLKIEAKANDLAYEKSVIFSISAGSIEPEDPQDVLLSSSEIDENNQADDLVGTFAVVDDARYEHDIGFSNNEAYPDNLSFRIEGKNLYAVSRFNYELKPSYNVNIQVINREFENKKIEKELVISIKDVAECKDVDKGGVWIHVPADQVYAQEDFCVMKYESQNIDELPYSGATGTPMAGGVSQNGAITRCDSLGEDYHLISNQEWMAIATNIAKVDSNWTGNAVGVGELVKGHTDNVPAQICAANPNDLNAYVEADCTGSPFVDGVTPSNQRRTHTLSNGEIIWDFSGNVLEFTSYLNPDKPYTETGWVEFTVVTASNSMPLTDLVPQIAIDNMWSSAQSIGKYIAGNPNVGGALQRGGSRASGENGGIFSANMWDSANVGSAVLGFRCAKSIP